MVDISDGIQFRRDGIDPSQWPQLICSAGNQLALTNGSLQLDENQEIGFQGNGQLRITGDLRLLSGNPATQKLVMLANGNVGIGESNPTAKLVVNGNLKLQQGVAVNEYSNDPNLTDNTDLAVPTEKAVKGYVDAKIAPVNAALSTKADKSGSLTQDFQVNHLTAQGNLQVTGTVTANKFVGDGSSLTGLLGVTQWVNGASGSISYSGGNVGIGTTSPVQKLQATGNAIINNTFLGDVGHGVSWAGFSHSNSVNTAGYALLQRNDGLYTLMNKKSGSGYLGFRVDNDDKMIINDSGNVGIGTTEPRTQLHVLRRISTGADFTSAGAITFYPPDGFAWFHIDNGPAGGRPLGRLRISHGVNPGDHEIINILQNMNVGIGTSNPQTPLHIYSDGNPTALRVQSAAGFGAGRIEFWSDPQGSQSEWRPSFIQSTDQGGFSGGMAFFVNGRGFDRRTAAVEVMRVIEGRVIVTGVVQQSSSRSLKENVRNLSAREAIATLEELNPVKFNYRTDSLHKQHLGFIAEDVPELVASLDRKALSSMDIVAVLTKVVQEQQATIATLTDRLNALESNVRLEP